MLNARRGYVWSDFQPVERETTKLTYIENKIEKNFCVIVSKGIIITQYCQFIFDGDLYTIYFP